jgi:predicted DNA-binding transcriptional regulator AlpA
VKLLSLQSIAKRLDVDPKTVRRWVAAGQFPRPLDLPPASGKEPIQRWPAVAVDAWILSRCQAENRTD